MTPTQESINQDIQSNLERIFGDVKLSKKAKAKVESILSQAIISNYRLHAINVVVDEESSDEEKKLETIKKLLQTK